MEKIYENVIKNLDKKELSEFAKIFKWRTIFQHQFLMGFHRRYNKMLDLANLPNTGQQIYGWSNRSKV